MYGAYVYADYSTGRFFALRKVAGKYIRTELLKTAYHPVTFGEDEAGELYVAQLGGTTRVFKVVQGADTTGKTTFPLKLSDTKCFSDIAALKPAKGVTSYHVNAPLWSDGASKHRHFSTPVGIVKKSKSFLPNASDTGSWQLPVGTLVLKTFALGGAAGNGPPDAAKQVKVETRFMHHDYVKGWRFFTYVWRADGKDADLVLDGAVRTYDVPGEGKKQWTTPSIAQCGACHGGNAKKRLLGWQTSQLLNAYSPYTKQNNGLRTMKAAGLIAGKFEPKAHKAFVKQGQLGAPPTDPVALDAHARTYMHVNCAVCHQPGGASNTDLDLRFGVALKDTKGCLIKPKKGDLGIVGGHLISPAKPAKSTLWHRMQLPPTSGDFMPEVGVSTKHAAGVALVKAWIASLKSCK